MDKVTINVESVAALPIEVRNFVQKFENEYDVEAIYHENNKGACWTLTGTPGALKDLIDDHWRSHGLLDWEEVLSDEDMKTLGIVSDPDFDRSISDTEYKLRCTAI